MLSLIFAATLLTSAAAEPRPVAARGNGIIRSPINALPGPPPKLRVRQNEVQVENQRQGTRYGVEIEVGTPPQKVTLILDTGSPDTWVNPSCATANVPADCRALGRFDYTKSTSLNETGVEDILVYGIGNATIQYVYETVTIGCKSTTAMVVPT
jgi:hypothetical protein